MKRKIFSIQSLLFISIILLGGLTRCQDKDTTAPRDTLAGPDPYNITLNEPYIEYGFEELWDNRDDTADLEITIENEISVLVGDYLNVDGENIFVGDGATIEAGEYNVTYTIKDKAGNTTIDYREVSIKNSLYKFTRTYIVSKENLSDELDTYDDYDTDLEAYENLNNRIHFPNFSNFDDVSISVYADVRGDSVFIPQQYFPADNEYLIEGNLDPENDGFAGMLNRNNYKIEIEFKASNKSTATQIFHEVYTKQ